MTDGVLDQHIVSSQADLHTQWGGILPSLARREHEERIESIIAAVLGIETPILKSANPGLDLIAVTQGPGLAIALEVGVRWAKELASAWSVPILPVNHMEGHFWSGLLSKVDDLAKVDVRDFLPALGVLLSGGHSEFVYSPTPGVYKKLVMTKDDAAGEAFDKFAVMVGLGYPGGAQVDAWAQRLSEFGLTLKEARENYPLPIPMQKSPELALSFSGLKTAARYLLEDKHPELSNSQKLAEPNLAQACASFQYSVVAGVELKLRKVLEKVSEGRLASVVESEKAITIKTKAGESVLRSPAPINLLCGGGAIANSAIQTMLTRVAADFDLELIIPEQKYLADNASMIALVAHLFNDYYQPIDSKKQDTENELDHLHNHRPDRQPRLSL